MVLFFRKNNYFKFFARATPRHWYDREATIPWVHEVRDLTGSSVSDSVTNWLSVFHTSLWLAVSKTHQLPLTLIRRSRHCCMYMNQSNATLRSCSLAHLRACIIVPQVMKSQQIIIGTEKRMNSVCSWHTKEKFKKGLGGQWRLVDKRCSSVVTKVAVGKNNDQRITK